MEINYNEKSFKIMLSFKKTTSNNQPAFLFYHFTIFSSPKRKKQTYISKYSKNV